MWIGLQDYRSRDLYEWSDHSPVTYTYWARDEPNNVNNDERCGDLMLKVSIRCHSNMNISVYVTIHGDGKYVVIVT